MTKVVKVDKDEIDLEIVNTGIQEVTEIAHSLGFIDDVASDNPDESMNGGASNYGPVLYLHEKSTRSNECFDVSIYDGSNPLCALSSRGHIYITFTAGGATLYAVPDFMDKLANIVVAFN